MLDARAIALHVHRESDSLVPVASDDETAVLDLLATERDAAVVEATRLRNQIHALLLQLDPGYQKTLPAMKSHAGLAIVLDYETTREFPLDRARAAAVRRLAKRLALALAQIDELTEQLRSLAAPRFTPLTRLIGVNLLTAGILAGILGAWPPLQDRCRARPYAGDSPIEASSAGRVRHRLNRGANRRLNAVLYRIALTQAHFSPDARAYLDRRVSEGKTRREVTRALKRFLIRAIGGYGRSVYPKQSRGRGPRAS